MSLVDKKIELIKECYDETKKLQEKLKLLEEIYDNNFCLWPLSNNLTTIIENLENKLGKLILKS